MDDIVNDFEEFSPRSPDDLRWQVYDEAESLRKKMVVDGQSSDASPIGVFRYTADELSFAWLPGATAGQKMNKVRGSLLSVKLRGQTHRLQLAKPVVAPSAIVVGDWKQPYEEFVDLETLEFTPSTSRLRARLLISPEMRLLKPQAGDQENFAEQEQLSLAFSTTAAGISAFFKVRRKQLEFTVAPGFQTRLNLVDVMVLSQTVRGELEPKLNRHSTRNKNELSSRIANRGNLSSALSAASSIRTSFPGGGGNASALTVKKMRIAEAKQAIANNDNRIKTLQTLNPLIDQEINSTLPQWKSLAQRVEGCRLGYELFVPIGEQRLVLYQKGAELAE